MMRKLVSRSFPQKQTGRRQVTDVLRSVRKGCYLSFMRMLTRSLFAAILVVAAWGVTGGAQPQPELAIRVQQGEFEREVRPIVRAGPVESFYNYSGADFNGMTGIEVPQQSLLLFYRNADTGRLSLIVIHGAPEAGTGGRARLEMDGLPSEAQLALRDDPADRYSFDPPQAQFEWQWSSGHTDGVVVSGLPDSFSLNVVPDFQAGIAGWTLISGGPGGRIERIELPSLTTKVSVSAGGPSRGKAGARAAGEGRVRAERTLTTPQAQPSSRFRVTIDVVVQEESNGLGLEEQLPTGWTVKPVERDGAVFKLAGSRAQWLFPTLLQVGERKRIVYEVLVPEAKDLVPSLPAKFQIQGSLSSVSPLYGVQIAGESELEVASCLSAPVAIAHLDLGDDRVDLRRSERISPEQLQRALRLWQSGDPVPGTCGARLSNPDLQRILRHQLLNIPVDQGLPPPTEERNVVSVMRAIRTPLPGNRIYLGAEGGNVFQVELTVRAERELAGLIVDERLPDRWQVADRTPARAVFRSGTVDWVIPHVVSSDEQTRIAYEVTVPTDADPGSVTIVGETHVGILSFLVPVEGEDSIQALECLPIPLAIAHLNVETGQIDMTLDNKVSQQQADAAFRYWLEDREVPGTCGKMMDLPTLQSVIGKMVSGEPVGG